MPAIFLCVFTTIAPIPVFETIAEGMAILITNVIWYLDVSFFSFIIVMRMFGAGCGVPTARFVNYAKATVGDTKTSSIHRTRVSFDISNLKVFLVIRNVCSDLEFDRLPAARATSFFALGVNIIPLDGGIFADEHNLAVGIAAWILRFAAGWLWASDFDADFGVFLATIGG